MNITMNGRTPESFGLKLLREGTEFPFLPETRDYTEAIEYRAGIYDFGADLNAYAGQLAFAVLGKSEEEVREKLRIFKGFLIRPDGRPREFELIRTDEPNKRMLVRYSGSAPAESYVAYAKFTVPIVSALPFAYSQEHTIAETVTDSSSTIHVQSAGTIQTPPVITLRNLGGPINGFRIIREVEVD